MPIYSVICPEGHRDQIWSKIDQRDNPRHCSCGGLFTRVIDKPYVAPDNINYASPITGKAINSRQQRREEMKRHGCIDWDPGIRQDAERNREANCEKTARQLDATVDKLVTEMHASNLI